MLTDQIILNCLNEKYSIQNATLTFLPIGADPNASVYKAETKEASFFVKLKGGHHHDISIDVVEYLHSVGIKQVIIPLKSNQNESSHRIEDFTLIVYPFIDGQDGFSRELTDEHWLMLGKTLKQVHDVDIPKMIYDEIRHEAYSPKWREQVRQLLNSNDSNASNDEYALKFIHFMKEYASVISKLLDRAEHLSHTIDIRSPKVLCHSDIHAGNVLIDKNSMQLYIVDWDEPIIAPKERDLMFIGGGVGNVWNNPHEEALFYKGYGKTEINNKWVAYYRHERIIEDIALYAHDLLFSTTANKAQSYQYFMSMFDPKGAVEIALKMDTN